MPASRHASQLSETMHRKLIARSRYPLAISSLHKHERDARLACKHLVLWIVPHKARQHAHLVTSMALIHRLAADFLHFFEMLVYPSSDCTCALGNSQKPNSLALLFNHKHRASSPGWPHGFDSREFRGCTLRWELTWTRSLSTAAASSSGRGEKPSIQPSKRTTSRGP